MEVADFFGRAGGCGCAGEVGGGVSGGGAGCFGGAGGVDEGGVGVSIAVGAVGALKVRGSVDIWRTFGLVFWTATARVLFWRLRSGWGRVVRNAATDGEWRWEGWL